MRQNLRIAAVIPALNEERAIGHVLQAVPGWVDEVIVVDNGSSDATAAVARSCGARVVAEPRRGYGRACLAGIAALSDPDVVVFLDGDFSDHPDEMDTLVDPIARGEFELVIGSRVKGRRERGALTPQARFGNRLSCLLIQLLWGVRYSDLGPFRAVRFETLRRLGMRDTGCGWTVEMQVKAAAASLPSTEVAVSYRRRIGASKISGTVEGVLRAGTKILYTILRAALAPPRRASLAPREKLIIFTRHAEPGKTKTRLIPALGAEVAARLQHAMTAHTLTTAGECAAMRPVAVEVRFEGGDEARLRGCFGSAVHYRSQGPGTLGERMRRCIREALDSGVESVAIVGADVPGLTAETLQNAFESLRDRDVVIGPSTDGGYYLIGARRDIPELFEDMPWGTVDVLRRTLEAASNRNLSVALLPPLSDVDRPEDLPALRADPRFADVWTGRPLLSVIIPAIDEAASLGRTLAHVLRAEGVEIVVADGGSRDATREIASRAGAVVLQVDGGRAAQQNAAAAVASSRLLLFLHADTIVPDAYVDLIRRALDEPGTVAGAFRFRTDAAGTAMRLVEWGTRIRSAVFQWPYADQGLFMEKRTFDEIGGFAPLPIMEDFELVRRLRRRGRIRTLRDEAVTSARRWRRLGVLRTTLRNQAMIFGFLAGVSPDRLRRFYAGKRPEESVRECTDEREVAGSTIGPVQNSIFHE